MRDRVVSAADTVIVFIDLQEGIVNVGATNDAERMRTSAAALADLATIFALPTLMSCVPTTSGTVAAPLAEIAARLPNLEPLTRTTPDAMDDLRFRVALDSFGRKTVILAGVATEVAVRQAALAAHRLGFHTVVAVDACGGLGSRTETATFIHLSAVGIELSSVPTIAAQLAGDFGSERGRAAMRALQSTLALRPHDHDTSQHGSPQ
jgi:nicotinamidase-related amidase